MKPAPSTIKIKIPPPKSGDVWTRVNLDREYITDSPITVQFNIDRTKWIKVSGLDENGRPWHVSNTSNGLINLSTTEFAPRYLPRVVQEIGQDRHRVGFDIEGLVRKFGPDGFFCSGFSASDYPEAVKDWKSKNEDPDVEVDEGEDEAHDGDSSEDALIPAAQAEKTPSRRGRARGGGRRRGAADS